MTPSDLHALGYHVVPWFRSPRKPAVTGWLEKRVNPDGFIRAYGDDLDWAIVPTDTVVLDLEMKGGLDGMRDLQEFGEVLPGAITQTKSGGFHYWFRQPEGVRLVGGHHIRPGIEAKAINGSVHIPPSVGYQAIVELGASEYLPVLPSALIDAWQKSAKVPGTSKSYAVEVYALGERRARLCSMAGKLRAAGLTEPELMAALCAVRDARCADPSTFSDGEIAGIAKDYGRRPERTEPDTSWFPRGTEAGHDGGTGRP